MGEIFMPIRRMGQAALQADLSVMELLWVGAHNIPPEIRRLLPMYLSSFKKCDS